MSSHWQHEKSRCECAGCSSNGGGQQVQMVATRRSVQVLQLGPNHVCATAAAAKTGRRVDVPAGPSLPSSSLRTNRIIENTQLQPLQDRPHNMGVCRTPKLSRTPWSPTAQLEVSSLDALRTASRHLEFDTPRGIHIAKISAAYDHDGSELASVVATQGHRDLPVQCWRSS